MAALHKRDENHISKPIYGWRTPHSICDKSGWRTSPSNSCWRSSSSSSGSSTSSLTSSDGRMYKPYRPVSHIPFVEGQTQIARPRTSKAGGNSFEKLFGSPEARRIRPKELTLFSPSPPQKRKNGKPLPVSPLTGHVIGTGGSQVVPLPSKPVRSPAGICHSSLW